MTNQPTTNELTLDGAYEILDGMSYKLDGVAGTIRVERVNGMTELVHHASAAGKRSAKYRATREQLGDDYTTTVSNDDDVTGELFAIAERIHARA